MRSVRGSSGFALGVERRRKAAEVGSRQAFQVARRPKSHGEWLTLLVGRRFAVFPQAPATAAAAVYADRDAELIARGPELLPPNPTSDERWMRHALVLAEHGRGAVEPNPMVGAV